MTSYDQLFKNLIEKFFADFLRLVLPDLSSQLRMDQPRFLDKQSFTDWPEGERREMDLLVEVRKVEGRGSVLVHIEIEARARRRTRTRLWQYYMQLRLRHDLLVLPILVNLKGGKPGTAFEILHEGIGDLETARFQLCVFSPAGCLAEDYLARPEPIAWGMASLMRSKRWSRAGQKVECLRRISECPELSGLERFLLVNCVETHLELTGQDSVEYAALRQAVGNQEVGAMEITWADKMIARGREEGLRDGLQEGLKEGLDALKQVVLRQLNQRFGPLPEGVRQRVQSIEEVEPLTRIAGDILVVRSLDEVKL